MTPFQKMLAEAAQSTNVSQLLAGQPYLKEGSHNVKITSASIGDDPTYGAVLKVTFANENEDVHNATIYCESTDKVTGEPKIGYNYNKLMTALFQEAATVVKFAAAVGANLPFVEVITGMRLNITLAPGKGVRVEALPALDGALPKYAGFENGEKVTGDFDSTKDVKDAVKARGDKVAYLNIDGMRCTHKLENTAVLDLGLENAKKARATKAVASF